MKLLKYIFIICIGVACFSSKMLADNTDQRDFLLMKGRAERGDKRAQQFLGMSYKQGLYGSKNIVKSIAWYTKSANQDDVESQYCLGRIYADGNDIAVDYVRAMKWFIKAASQGDSMAQISLAFMYKDGRKGLSKDKSKADMYAQKVCSGIDYSRIVFIHPDSLPGQCLMYNDFEDLKNGVVC